MTDLSLGQFTTLLMRELSMAEAPTPVQLQIIDYLENGPKRRVICGFRGVGKSTLSAMYLLWSLYRNPDEKILIISASMGRAKAMAEWMYTTICRVSWLKHMKPDTRDGRYSKVNFDVGTCRMIEQSPSVRAAGIEGQITGSRASKILIDDCETPQTCLTQLARERLREALNECESILKPEAELAWQPEIVYLGTPHSSVESIYFILKKDLNYDMRMWPARVPADVEAYNGCLAPSIFKQLSTRVGRPTDTRFSDEELTQRQLSMSPSKWRLQFMLDATLTDIEKYPLRCADLMVMTLDQYLPEIVIYEKAKHLSIDDLPCVGMAHDPRFYRPAQVEGQVPIGHVPTVMALDPAAGGADEFAWAIVKAWAGNYFLVASGGVRGGSSEALWMKLATLAKSHGVNEILVETNFGGLEVWSQVMKPYFARVGHPCRIEPVRSNQRKELRIIDTLAPVLQTHRLVVDRRVVEVDAEMIRGVMEERDASYSLFYQMTRLTHDRGCLIHDDRLDAWAMAIAWLQEQAAQDQRDRQAARQEELLAAELEDWFGNVLMSPDRSAMGMSLEQAKMAAARSSGGLRWV